MKIKLSFKKKPKETGLRAVGYPYADTDIKIDKKSVGYINAPTWNSKSNKWVIRFAVKKTEPDDNPNCDWKWITMKEQFEEEPLAREYVKSIIEKVISKYIFHYFED